MKYSVITIKQQLYLERIYKVHAFRLWICERGREVQKIIIFKLSTIVEKAIFCACHKAARLKVG